MLQTPRQLLPSVVVCPKNPDSLKYPLVLKDIAKRLPHLDRLTIGNLITEELKRLNALLKRWKGQRTLEEFYKDLFEKYGYTCEDMFQACFSGYEKIPCCDIFRPYYLMLRGRCFRTKQLFQTDPDVFGRLNIYINQMPSRLVSKADGMQPHIVVYVTDKHPDVGHFPRYYINLHEAIYVRVRGKRIVMLDGNSQCSSKKEYKGRSTCFMKKWMRQRLLDPLNCTLFYLKDKAVGYDVCEPDLVVQHYSSVNNLKLDDNSQRCLPACRRRDLLLQLYRSESSVPRFLKKIPDFRLELSYVHLERERYEEVITTTVPGFISQIGGQSGLFVGLSPDVVTGVSSPVSGRQGWLSGCPFQGLCHQGVFEGAQRSLDVYHNNETSTGQALKGAG
uniref:Uncharacterized protein n=1 Tax=Ditylenchus dipsaci TaxID=166011 RepID=A0A915DB18_9BILA